MCHRRSERVEVERGRRRREKEEGIFCNYVSMYQVLFNCLLEGYELREVRERAKGKET